MKNNRIYELDLIRGILVLGMMLYHLGYDLNTYYGFQIPLYHGIIEVLFSIGSCLFILLPGINTYLTRSNVKRGLKVLAAGLLVTVVTYWYHKEDFVLFGILQCIGVCILLSDLLKKIKHKLAAAAVCLIAGYLFSRIHLDTLWLLPLGITPLSYQSIDYYPLFPSLGFYLIGVWIGEKYYSQNKKGYLPYPTGFTPVSFVGKHAFLFYLIHQPILLLILLLIFLQ